MVKVEILILFVVTFVVHYLWKHRRYYYLGYKLPYSDHDFSLKGILNMINADTKIIYQIINDAFKNKNHISKTWFGSTTLVVGVVKPEDVQIILNSRACMDKPKNIKFLNITKGSILGDMEYWKPHRKIMNPYFGPQGLKSLIPIFNDKVKIMMENLRKMEGKGEFDVLNFSMALTLETIMDTMEYEMDIQNQKEEIRDSFRHNLEKLLDIVTKRMFKLWLHPDFIYTRTPAYRQEIEARSEMIFKFSDQIVQNVQKKLETEESGNENNYKSFIRALLDSKYKLTRSEISDEVKSITFAGQDTTSVAASSTLLLLAMYKDVQQKVVDELRRVFGNITEAPFMDIETLNELVYLEMVINESMRIIPVVPFVVRKVLAEVPITDGYILPEGTNAIIPICILHHSKAIWGDDALKFRPERFEKESFEKIHPYGFLPFTKGPRMCLGWRYAMYMMKIQLASFLLHYELDTTLKFEELDYKVHITMSICQGHMISIKERTN